MLVSIQGPRLEYAVRYCNNRYDLPTRIMTAGPSLYAITLAVIVVIVAACGGDSSSGVCNNIVADTTLLRGMAPQRTAGIQPWRQQTTPRSIMR